MHLSFEHTNSAHSLPSPPQCKHPGLDFLSTLQLNTTQAHPGATRSTLTFSRTAHVACPCRGGGFSRPLTCASDRRMRADVSKHKHIWLDLAAVVHFLAFDPCIRPAHESGCEQI
eukprot:1090884-Pelagomonas_calceolata.AAC.3